MITRAISFRPTTVAELRAVSKVQEDKSGMPNLFGGISNMVKWKNLDVEIFFTYETGQHILDLGEHEQSYVDGQTNLRATLTGGDNPNQYYSNAPEGSGYVDPFLWFLPPASCTKLLL